MYFSRFRNILKKTNKINTKPFCYAPYGSLCFMPNGDINVCFYNRYFTLGRYPENTIDEVWNGKKIKQIRRLLKNNDLSRGCQGCAPEIKDNNKYKEQYDFLKHYNQWPKNFDFQLSNICNLSCKMCTHENSVNVPTIGQTQCYNHIYDKNFLKQLEKYIPFLEASSFIGGETFLVDIFYEMWERYIKINNKTYLNITTNGTVFNERIENLLMRGNFYIMLSIDSFRKSTYEEIRRNARFENTMENINKFDYYRRIKGGNLQLNICLLKDNWEEMPSIFDYCCKRGFIVYLIYAISPKRHSLKFISSEELIKIREHLITNKNNINWNNFLSNKNIYNNLIDQIEAWRIGAEEYEKSTLFKLDDTGALLNSLYASMETCLAKEMDFLSKKNRKFIKDKFDVCINKAHNHLSKEETLNALIKNLHRMPLCDFAIEALTKDDDTFTDILLMFR